MKPSYAALCLLGFLLSCSHPLDPFEGDSSSEELLQEAYQEQSDEKLREFFEEWQHAVQPITESELESRPEIERALYSLYETFYDPRFPSKLGGSEWGDGIYKDAEYFIVQNKLYYRQVPDPGDMVRSRFDSDDDYWEYVMSRDSLSNFRPRLGFPETDVVYLTEEFESLISDFLVVAEPDNASEWVDQVLYEERAKRRQFIGRLATIIPGHWFGWHILTHPEVSTVEVDSTLTRGHVEFRIVYQGGYADYAREGGEWQLREARLTWIE